ncbi:MAG: hypothetical protein Q9220_007483 [cf. Caloplaca sp. 1 TL-2023]
MAPGNDLDTTTRDFLRSILGLIHPVEDRDVPLFSWMKRVVTLASTDAIYGSSKNPFQDPSVEAGFWAVDRQFALLGLNLFPSILAPAGYRGRDVVFQGFHRYYAQDGHKNASPLVQARYEVHQKHGIGATDMEHFDLSVCIGLLVNTVPATFWTLCYTYSQASLIADVRAAISPYVELLAGSGGPGHYRVDIAKVVADCSLLASIVQETLRVQSTNASGRVVLKDTILDDKYFLKRDAMLLMPSAELHTNASVWGSSCKEFDPRRFMQQRNDKGSKKAASAYRAFGGGSSLCPGRFLSKNEIMIVLVIMVLQYDMYPEAGKWTLPKSYPHITTSILTPVKDVGVRIKKRQGYELATWEFGWKETSIEAASAH